MKGKVTTQLKKKILGPRDKITFTKYKKWQFIQ